MHRTLLALAVAVSLLLGGCTALIGPEPQTRYTTADAIRATGPNDRGELAAEILRWRNSFHKPQSWPSAEAYRKILRGRLSVLTWEASEPADRELMSQGRIRDGALWTSVLAVWGDPSHMDSAEEGSYGFVQRWWWDGQLDRAGMGVVRQPRRVTLLNGRVLFWEEGPSADRTGYWRR